MASRTVVDSVERVTGPSPNAASLAAALAQLRARYPGVIIERYLDRVPTIAATAFLAPGVSVVGAVVLADDVSIWFGSVVRADVNRVEIRERSNLQDGVVVHLGDRDPTFVGPEVVVGHRAVLHGCTIEGGCLVGIQSTILDGARIGEGSVIGACALVTSGMHVPPHSLVLGAPAKVIKTLTAEDEVFHRKLAAKYCNLAHNYKIG